MASGRGAGGDRAATLSDRSSCVSWNIVGCTVLHRAETLEPLQTSLEATVVPGERFWTLFAEGKDGRHPVRMVRVIVAWPSFDEVEAANAVGVGRGPVRPFHRANPQPPSLEVPLRELVEADAVAFLGAGFAADNAARCHHLVPHE